MDGCAALPETDVHDPFRHLRHRIARRESRKCRDDLKTVFSLGLCRTLLPSGLPR